MRKHIVFVLALIVVGAFASGARADTVNITLTSAGNNILANIYMGPYTGTVNGTPESIICDDFVDDSYINESWVANVTKLADVSTTSPTDFHDQTKYEEAAWLATKLLDPTTTCKYSGSDCAGDIQFAIWELLEPAGPPEPFSLLSGNNLLNATDWWTRATTQTFSVSQFSNLVIYTPTSTPPICNGYGCKPTTPQEFITFVPEPSTVQLLGAGLMLLAVAALRRSKVDA